jgi:hypothetical protein
MAFGGTGTSRADPTLDEGRQMADSEQKKAGLTAVRIPALILTALVVMLLIGIVIYKVA